MQVEWGVADIVPVPVVTPSAHAPALEAIDPSPALSLPVGDNKGTLGAIVERPDFEIR